MAPPSLSIAVVTYASDLRLLARTLASLADAVAFAHEKGTIGAARLCVVDNGPEETQAMLFELAGAALQRAPGMSFEVVSGHGNVGFARANNLALARSRGELHLILNPDVEMDREAIDAGLRYLLANPAVGALTPSVHGPDGERQYLVKDYPGIAVLLVRGFLPAPLQRPFRGMLHAYEMRQLDWEREQSPVALASGCFLLCRRAALDEVGGFDPQYFLYFEDFDLTLRLAKVTRIAYCPQVRIVHHGGESSSKGLRHIGLFARSAIRFFSTHGWFGPAP
jgi:GT2 family glycosyltransferase